MGPGDGYILQYTKDTASFWAERNRLELGACLDPWAGAARAPPKRIQGREEFNQTVQHGFQASYTLQQGSIVSGSPLRYDN